MTEADHDLKNSDAAKERSVSHERRGSNWDVSNGPKNYISLVGAHVVTAVFSFASVWIITKHLGSAGYGTIIAVVAASQLAQIFLNWSSTSLSRFGIEEFVETGKITRSFWSRTLIFAPNLLLILVLTRVWLPPVAAWLKIPDDVVWLIAAHLIATSIWLHTQNALQGVKFLRLQGAMLSIERIFSFVGIAILISLDRLTLANALWCYIIPSLLLTASGLLALRKFIAFDRVFESGHLRRMLIYSLPLIPFALVGYLSTSQLDAFFITRYLSTHELGIYSVAAQINGIALQLPILANTILVSTFVSIGIEDNEGTRERFFQHLLPSIALGWGVLCSLGGLLGATLLPFVFGFEFSVAEAPLWILFAASALSAPAMFGYAAFSHAISATHISAAAAIGASVTNLVLNLILIPSFGLAGCAAASFASAGLLNFIVVQMTAKRSGMATSWVHFVCLPPFLGVFALALSGTVFLSFVSATVTALLIGLRYRDSIKLAISMMEHRFLLAER